MGTSAEQVFGQLTAIEQTQGVSRLNRIVAVHVKEAGGLQRRAICRHPRNRLRPERIQEAKQLRSVVLGDLAISVDTVWERPIVPPLLSLLRRPHSGREHFQVASDSAD